MQPLSAFKPPQVTEETERVFRDVNHAFNEIDRRLYPPVETLDDRRGLLVAEYEDVGKRFAAAAASCVVDDWLRYSVASRIFTTIVFVESRLDEARRYYHQMERLGHPSVSPLISLRMIWANVLAEANRTEEAQTVARQLLEDMNAIRSHHPNVLSKDFDTELADFCKRHRI